MGNAFQIGRIALLIACFGITAIADVKIKSRQTTGGQTFENTTHIKGKRQRTENMNGQMVSIQQCDLKRTLQLMPQLKAYTVHYYEEASSGEKVTSVSKVGSGEKQTRGGVVTTTITTKDTGERKEIFGYAARRILTTIETVSSPEACNQNLSKMVQDGWYIDASFQPVCDLDSSYQYARPAKNSGCQDRYETKQIGMARKGYPVWEKTTMFDPNGSESFSMFNEVIEISQATLDAALFEVPADYREVKDFSAALTSGTADDRGLGVQVSNVNTSVASKANFSTEIANAVSQKKAGVVRLGLAKVKTGAVGEGLNATELAAAVSTTLSEFLKAPNIELIQLEARLPAQVEAEAKQKECDYIIFANVSHKKGGGGFGGMFGSVAPAVSSVAPMAGYGSTAGAVAGHVATTAIYTAASMSANVKSKDEINLEVKVQAPGTNAATVSKQYKAKAKSNGEDIISPVIEQAAQAIVDAVVK